MLSVDSVSVDTSIWEFFSQTGTISNTTGQVNNIIVNSFNADVGLTDFVVASITFSSIGAGNSNLNLSGSSLNPWSSSGNVLNPGYIPANITVVPTPAAFLLFISGFLVLVRVRTH